MGNYVQKIYVLNLNCLECNAYDTMFQRISITILFFKSHFILNHLQRKYKRKTFLGHSLPGLTSSKARPGLQNAEIVLKIYR